MSNLVSFTPLMRQTVGFDRFNDLFENLLNETEERFDNYPPYNIEKASDDDYIVTLAVAGFAEKDLDITLEGDRLTVSGRIAAQSEQTEKPNYLHQGIATRAFQRSFRLADHIKVVEAKMENGLLGIHLQREVPEEKKPRMIPINTKSSDLLGKTKKK